MNWSDIDLNSPSERDASILDAYTFDGLLLEIHCNIRDINQATVEKQFETSLQANVAEARSIFKANLDNIVKQAQKERNQK